jgi:hypothetical protein
VRCHTGQPDIFTLATYRFLAHEEKVQREANIEWVCVVDFLNVFVGQLERQSGDVAIQVRLLAASDDREDVRSLMEDISEAAVLSVNRMISFTL